MSVHRFKTHKRQKEIKHYTSLLCRYLSFIIVSSKTTFLNMGPLWSWSYGSWFYNYLCNQCLSPLTLWVWIPLRQGVLYATLCGKVCQWLEAGRDFLWVFQFPPSIKLTTKVVNPIKIYIYSEPFNINLIVAFMSVCVVYIPLLVVSLIFVFVYPDCHYTQTFHRT